jgi:cytochrome P450
MELFRTISPSGGSISALEEVRTPPYRRHGYIVTPHTSTSLDPVHWHDPETFDPDRYNSVPTSDDITEARVKQMGLAQCPFSNKQFDVKDGRNATLNNSGFGTVYGVIGGKSMPVCDYAGFGPFSFGYRRCPGEQLTLLAFEDFLRKVWRDKIEFVKLNIPNPEPLPIGLRQR